MQFLNDNAPVILTILLVFVLLFAIFTAIATYKLVKNLVSKRFSFHDIKEVDKDTNEQKFSIIVANRSLNDVAVNAIGVVSGLKFFDFQKNYRELQKLTGETKPVIPQRNSVKLSISVDELEKLIFANADKGKLKRTYVYVIDSSGNMSKCAARSFHKILKADFKALMKVKHNQAKRADFDKTSADFAAREAAGNPVGFGERVKLVFARFPAADQTLSKPVKTEKEASKAEKEPAKADTEIAKAVPIPEPQSPIEAEPEQTEIPAPEDLPAEEEKQESIEK